MKDICHIYKKESILIANMFKMVVATRCGNVNTSPQE
jgi:hypothetical protein